MAKIGEGIHLAAVAGERVNVSDEDDEGFFEFNVVLAFAQHVEIYHGLVVAGALGKPTDGLAGCPSAWGLSQVSFRHRGR